MKELPIYIFLNQARTSRIGTFDQVLITLTQEASVMHGDGLFGLSSVECDTGVKRVQNFKVAINSPASTIQLKAEVEPGTINCTVRFYYGVTIRGMGHGRLRLFDTNTGGLGFTIFPKNYKDGCFITTATLNYLKKGDDCKELQLFRKVRDEFVENHFPKYAEAYRSVAPKIVERINQLENSEEIYKGIWEDYLSLVYEKLCENRYNEAFSIYTSLMEELSNDYLNRKVDKIETFMMDRLNSNLGFDIDRIIEEDNNESTNNLESKTT